MSRVFAEISLDDGDHAGPGEAGLPGATRPSPSGQVQLPADWLHAQGVDLPDRSMTSPCETQLCLAES
jgi:hypothetical protein